MVRRECAELQEDHSRGRQSEARPRPRWRQTGADYWSEYDVPLGLKERLDAVIREARGEE